MIHRIRPKPRKILFNEAVLRRLPANHPDIPAILEDSKKERVDIMVKSN